MLGRKPHYQLYCQTMTWRIPITLTSLDYSTNAWQKKHANSNQRSAQEEKLSKFHIAGMATANAVGDKILMLVIEKAQNLRCFKNVKFLPSQYQNQKKKKWMNGLLLEEWAWELNRKFSSEERSVALVIDDCLAHPNIENLKSIKLFFLPPNTTSTIQPMDQSVIRSLKAKYLKNMVQNTIRNLEKNNVLPEVLI